MSETTESPEERRRRKREEWRRAHPEHAQRLDCPHRGEVLLDDQGEPRTRDCSSCKGHVRLKVHSCQHPARAGEEITRQDCAACVYRPRPRLANPAKLLLVNHLCPGDVLVMTAAVRSLHQQHPGQYLTDVDTTAGSLWDFNPDVEPLDRGADDVRRIEMHYPLINHSDTRPVHFLHGYVQHLGQQLDIRLEPTVNRPQLWLSNEEKSWINQVEEITQRPTRFWLINAGTKYDYTAKGWGLERYQAVVDALAGHVQFVQIGEAGHRHYPLRGVINLLGRTDIRQLVRLAWHAQGGLGPSTFLQHVCAAFQKPYVCVAGGREPVQWLQYPQQTTLHTIGQLDCCREGACWKSRTVALGDGDAKDQSLCAQPVLGSDPVPRCLALIRPGDVVRAIERYYEGGVLTY